MTTGKSHRFLTEQERAAQREIYTFRIGMWNGVLFTLIAIVSTIATIQTGLYAFGGIAITLVIALVSFLAAYLARRGKASVGSALLVGTILLLSFTLPVIAKGQGVPLAFLTIIIVSSISTYTLTPQWTARTTVASILAGLLIILADLFLPDLGIPNDPQVTYVISILAGFIYVVVLLRRLGNFSLRAKLITSFILITLLPILTLSFYNHIVTHSILTQQAESNLKLLASETSQNIEQFISSQLDIIRMEAQQPILAEVMQQNQFIRNEAQEAVALKTLLTFVRKNPVFIQSYALLDLTGKIVLSTNPSQIGQNESQTEHFRLALSQQQPLVSNVIFISNGPVIYFIAPIRAENGLIVGMLRAEYNAVILQYSINARKTETEAEQRIRLLDKSTFVRLADTQERRRLYTVLGSLSPEQLIALQNEQKLPAGAYEEVVQYSPELAQAIQNASDQSQFYLPNEQRTASIFAVGQTLTTHPWVVVAQQSERTIYARADEQARTLALVSIGLTLFALTAGILTSQVISRPLSSLTQVARQITQGDFSARASIRTDDEVGQLAYVFNEMTTRLNQTLAELEQHVKERTMDLQAANEQSSQRARQLQSIADVSKIITREQNLEKLLPLVTDVVSEQFGYYHVGIFLLDDTRRAAVLQASNSPGGQQMVANNHRLTLGTDSIVGYAALTGKPRIALDVGEDAVFFNNPNLPETRSEMALPLVARGAVIGVIDMQSKQAGAFTQEDIDILSILADQIAIAIENARLFQQTQVALKETQAIVQSFLRQEWSALASKQTTVGYLHTGISGKLLSTPIEKDEIEQAIRRGAVVKKESNTDEAANPILVIPITLGEQVIGAIRVQAPDRNRAWGVDEINLLKSISERVGLALDNARLVASSQKRAAKERTISEISSKISAANDIDTILKTVAEEIGRTLSNADVVIQLKQAEEE